MYIHSTISSHKQHFHKLLWFSKKKKNLFIASTWPTLLSAQSPKNISIASRPYVESPQTVTPKPPPLPGHSIQSVLLNTRAADSVHRRKVDWRRCDEAGDAKLHQRWTHGIRCCLTLMHATAANDRGEWGGQLRPPQQRRQEKKKSWHATGKLGRCSNGYGDGSSAEGTAQWRW